jgi:hypothetical protein
MSYRPSHSNPSLGGSRSFTPAQIRLMEKQRELEAFQKVLLQSKELVSFFNKFGDKYDVLGGGSEGTSTS